MYAGSGPPARYTLQHVIDDILPTADAAGFHRFHLVGYSGGRAASLAFTSGTSRLPAEPCADRARLDGERRAESPERAIWNVFDRIEQMLPAFVGHRLAAGIEPAATPARHDATLDGRPAGLRTLIGTSGASSLDLDRPRDSRSRSSSRSAARATRLLRRMAERGHDLSQTSH
jgi:pimeloyl-ACP methyl ester carboxylesterase